MSKVCLLADLIRILQPRRAAGQRVVFTNGCFDLLHVGHLRTLQWARSQGDVLVVGVNSDTSVARLKGAHRPLVGEQDRAELLAGFECVDFVVVFSEDTPTAVLQQLRPEVHVKGGDYVIEEMPETAVVRAYGGEIRLTPLVEGRSTTTLEQQIREATHRRQ